MPVGESPSKPEWLPDQFWDGEAGTAKYEDFGKAFNDLSAFKAEQDSRIAAVPETPEGYELKLPPDFKMPDGYVFEIDPTDPMVALGRQVAKEAGLDQVGFEKLVAKYAEAQVPQVAELNAAVERQMQALGPQAQQRVDAVKQFLAAKLGPDTSEIFSYNLKTKAGVEAFERLIRLTVGGGGSSYSQSGRDIGGKAEVAGWDEMSAGQKFLAAKRS